MFRLFIFEAEAVVKEVAADTDVSNRQARRGGIVAEDAAACRAGVYVSVLGIRRPLGKKFDAGSQCAEQVFEVVWRL